jgi:hypothetical protein
MAMFGLAWHGLMTRASVRVTSGASSSCRLTACTILTVPDVLEVLVAEYRFALVRRGHRRGEIDDLVHKAKERLDRERRDPTGELMVQTAPKISADCRRH